jgi:hypothetical protein
MQEEKHPVHQLIHRATTLFSAISLEPQAVIEEKSTSRIATKGCNIILHPLKSQQRVLNALVASPIRLFQGKKAKGPQAIVDRNHNRVSVCDIATVIFGIGAETALVRSTLDPYAN